MAHLGGHENKTWIDKGALSFLANHLEISSMLDIGCGPGGMKKIAKSLDIKWLGIDGDPNVKQDDVLIHDFTKGAVDELETFDLGWSIEFLEHVYEKYQSNYMNAFSKCKFIFCTAAPPGFGGVHHVNEQYINYWIKVFKKYGFKYNHEATNMVINHSTMDKHKKTQRNFVQMTGMFFRNEA